MELILKRKEKLPINIIIGLITLPFEVIFGILFFLFEYVKWILNIQP
ncbi:hypothetical protein MCETHM1_00924 [Flavobacteriaceae bacterium]|jgi:hypothetical protein